MIVTSLLHLYSLLTICVVAGTKINVSSDGLIDTVTPSTLLTINSSQYIMMLLCSSNLSRIHRQYVDCSQNEPLLTPSSCATYDEDRGIFSLFSCPDFQPTTDSIKLLSNLSELSDKMCGPFNRKGAMCSECADGFGLSVTSFGYRCVNCSDAAWYGVPLFLLLKFAPITALYFIVLIFQIRVTSAPLPCFIMYAQLTIFFLSTSPSVFFAVTDSVLNLKLDVKVILTLYGLFTLNFCHNNILPPYCISSKLEPIHLSLINYISVLHPITLILLT